MKKNIAIGILCLALFACSSPNSGNIDNATILNWENDMVTTDQFVRDHRACLGMTRPAHQPRNRMAQILMPNQGGQRPQWDGMWVTFQSNENRDIPQRFLMSSPPGTSSRSIGSYRQCMFKKGYLLRAR
jgi:hypothetical protein